MFGLDGRGSPVRGSRITEEYRCEIAIYWQIEMEFDCLRIAAMTWATPKDRSQKDQAIKLEKSPTPPLSHLLFVLP